MAREAQPQTTAPAPSNEQLSPRQWPPEVAPLLARVEQILRTGEPGEALALLDRSRDGTTWVVNARGVCLLRLGLAQRALELFRALALNGIAGLREGPTVFKTNYATARLLSGDVTGCIVTLGQIRDEGHPTVRRLRDAIRRWRQDLPFWDRVRWFLGGDVGRLVPLDFPPGDL
jgi:hypothetical protein